MTIGTASLPRPRSSSSSGLALVLASAAMLAALGITTQLAYGAGASVSVLLPGRFIVTAALVWLIVAISGAERPSRRQAIAGLGLGAVYSAHAACYSGSLSLLDAGLVDLVGYTYPVLVTVWVVARRQEAWTARSSIALTTSTGGTAMVLMGGVTHVDPLGVVLSFGSAIAYAAYTLLSARALKRGEPLVLTALVTTGAAVTLTAGGAVGGGLSTHCSGRALLLVAAVGVIAVGGMGAFVAGIGLLGASRASIVSAVQPAFTALLGFAVFGDRLGPAQIVGGAMVIGAIVVLESGRTSTSVERWDAWLPSWERRVVAVLTRAVELPSGSRLVIEGDAPDGFFIIDHGRAMVIRDGRVIAKLGPGEFFGEMSLLRGGPRTATVVAGTDVRIRVLERRWFGGAMRGLPRFAHTVRHAAEERLGPVGAPATA
jgi:drug/metabolite transporter (DMT)-like permease